MSEGVEQDFINIIDMLEEDKIDEAKSELNILMNYVVRTLQNYEDNYKRISEYEMYDVDRSDFYENI